MKKQDAVSHFGSQSAIARALNISKQAVHHWGEFVPPANAIVLERITDGALKYRPENYPATYHRPGGRLWKPTGSDEPEQDPEAAGSKPKPATKPPTYRTEACP